MSDKKTDTHVHHHHSSSDWELLVGLGFFFTYLIIHSFMMHKYSAENANMRTQMQIQQGQLDAYNKQQQDAAAQAAKAPKGIVNQAVSFFKNGLVSGGWG